MSLLKRKPAEKAPDLLDPQYIQKRDDESNQAYNERVPIAFQPIAPNPTHTYLGEEIL